MLKAPGERRNGNDKQNVSLTYLFNIAFLKVRGVLKSWEKLRLSDGAFGCCEYWRYWAGSTEALRFKLTRFDRERSTAKNYRLDQFSVLLPCFFFPPLKDYPGFQLNQSCLWLEIMSMFAGLQMNTVAPGLLSSTQSHHADTFEEGRKEKPWPSETN